MLKPSVSYSRQSDEVVHLTLLCSFIGSPLPHLSGKLAGESVVQ